MHARICTLALLSALPACANKRAEASPAAEVPAAVTEAEDEAEDELVSRAEWDSLALGRGLHLAPMTEAVVDPSATAALTMDATGGVRLWQDLRAEDVALPLSLPVVDPAWMSIARRGGGYLLAFVDAAGGAVLAQVDPKGDTPHWIPVRTIAPTDPVFEIHALADGQRFLGLTVDHRILLWDAEGNELAQLDEPGFVPWQLRVAQTPGRAPSVLAVLAGPSRVQRIEVGEDTLRRSGDALAVSLDRGPNRNDLGLAPDGKTLVTLQGPRGRGSRFEVEFTDLASGERTVAAAETDGKGRPRMHLVSGQRVLLETGSGQGLWLERAAAAPWPRPADEAVREALPLATTSATPLPASDAEGRMHTSVVAGLRVAPGPRGLVVDPLDDAPSRRLAARSFSPAAVALDATGSRVAWATGAEIVLEPVADGGAPLGSIAAGADGTSFLAFVGEDQIVRMSHKGDTTLHPIAGGDPTASTRIEFEWGLGRAGWLTQDGLAGDIVVSSIKPTEPLRVLHVDESGFGEVRAVPRKEQASWPHAGKPRNVGSRDWLARLGLSHDQAQLRDAKIEITEPDPRGRYLAIAQKSEHHEGFDSAADTWVVGPHDYVVTVYDRQEQMRRFTVPAPALRDLAWSGDGSRLAIVYAGGGIVFDAATGEAVLSRHDLGLDVTAD